MPVTELRSCPASIRRELPEGLQGPEQRNNGGLDKWEKNPCTFHLPVREELGSEEKVTCQKSLSAANQGLEPRSLESQTRSPHPTAFCRHAVSFISREILLVIVWLLTYD